MANRRATHNVVVLELAPEHGSVFSFKAGQFVMLRLLNDDGTLWRQEAFSICSTPSRTDAIELAFKIYGPFTQRAAALTPGTVVEIAGPYGTFTLDESAQAITFLSGGIGVTPFLSMIRDATERKLPITMRLLYANHTKEDIPYFDELNALAKQNPNLTIVHVISQGDVPAGLACESGRMNDAIIQKHGGDPAHTFYYLCGPPPFMHALSVCLLNSGVSKDRIKLEHF
ncbi:MAG: FAD-dependent oxidoreductase [Candidatus Kerfeldbacteria bacterium]|nr:FAD-dependent oxidoreductase [Candidatus Kerfeldbacteria bacterium]